MRSEFVLCLNPHGFHRLHYTEWGDRDNSKVVFCVHGLTRNCRDFDYVADTLADSYRVICPDMPGRGLSDWLSHRMDYNLSVYMNDIAILLAKVGTSQIDWIGTSMGGMIGMMLAALPGTPIKSLVLNDIGPSISDESKRRIADYVGTDPRFSDMAGVEAYIRRVHAPFGSLTEAHWRHLAQHSAKKIGDNEYALHYDPGIADAFKRSGVTSVDLWPVWDRINCPVKLLRGANSDLLTAETVNKMMQRGPKTSLVEFPEVGHAPALMSHEQMSVIIEWLNF